VIAQNMSGSYLQTLVS